MTNITTINLGKNGPLVSKLGLGCMRMSSVWGGPTNDETESAELPTNPVSFYIFA